MGLFSSEGICAICGAHGNGKVISDGFLCNICAKKCASYLRTIPWKNVTVQQVKDIINVIDRDCKRFNQFSVSETVGNCFQIDEEHKYWRPIHMPLSDFDPGIMHVFSYDQIKSFELLQNGEAVTKGGLRRAIAGGLLFGGVGAIVGGVTGTKTTSQVITEYKIRVEIEHPALKDVMLYVLPKGKKLKPTDSAFLKCSDDAKRIFTILDSIVNENKPKEKETPALPTSAADEILKFKQLMDQGIISADEFEAKKKQLLNL